MNGDELKQLRELIESGPDSEIKTLASDALKAILKGTAKEEARKDVAAMQSQVSYAFSLVLGLFLFVIAVGAFVTDNISETKAAVLLTASVALIGGPKLLQKAKGDKGD